MSQSLNQAYVPPPFAEAGIPDFSTVLMPQGAFDNLVNTVGIRMGWLQGFSCPCTHSGATPGAAKANCLTCLGRSVYWPKPLLKCNTYVSFMHTGSAPDEPGFQLNDKIGPVRRSMPTLSIPKSGPNNEAYIYDNAGPYDAWIELDGAQRLSAILVSQTDEILPYQQGVIVESVTTYDPVKRQVMAVKPTEYTQVAARITLDSNIFPPGTPYVVQFTATPVWVAFGHSGGEAHNRPFGLGNSGLPKRFHLMELDAWTRSSFNGETPQGQLIPDANGDPNPIIPGIAISFNDWS